MRIHTMSVHLIYVLKLGKGNPNIKFASIMVVDKYWEVKNFHKKYFENSMIQKRLLSSMKDK